MKQLSEVEKQQRKAEDLKQQVMHLLRWSEMDYAQFQYECGIAYLRWYLPTDEQTVRALQRSKRFWNWWKNCWANRDEVFVESMIVPGIDFGVSADTRMYKYLHDPRELAMEIWPGKMVMEDVAVEVNIIKLTEAL